MWLSCCGRASQRDVTLSVQKASRFVFGCFLFGNLRLLTSLTIRWPHCSIASYYPALSRIVFGNALQNFPNCKPLKWVSPSPPLLLSSSPLLGLPLSSSPLLSFPLLHHRTPAEYPADTHTQTALSSTETHTHTLTLVSCNYALV